MAAPGPLIPSSDDRTRTWLILAVGVVVTAALVAGLIALWPGGGADEARRAVETATTSPADSPTTRPGGGTGEPSQQTTTPTSEVPAGPVDLFSGDLPAAFADLLAAAGNPTELIELAVYDTYAFLAYRDPANPANIDRRTWRDGAVGDPEPNPSDDRFDADTEPALFAPGEIDPAVLAGLTVDAPSHYDLPTAVSHVLVDRFLPFDQRVLIRVYVVPTDGRSGGGYVSYDAAGALVSVCC